MYLKSLTIQGFKSFPDKTLINFGDGITGIVGPNGSGKSNIVDAIRWVLGEQSTRTLRGGKMEDVIFLGTLERNPVGYAEVALTIDNQDGALPVDFGEVTVTRRLYRSGESEYYINRSMVRLRDINELFMNTGLGRDGYSIIGQGRIADVLSTRSEERRSIFEEAAGIAKFRYRKVEAERKLSSTDENMVRLSDILAELTDRVEPLRIQSEKARRYLDLREERKKLEINLWLLNVEKSKESLARAEQDYGTAQSDLAAAEQSLRGAEGDVDAAFERMQQINIEIDETVREIRALEESAAELRRESAVLENDISHREQEMERIAKSIEQAGQKGQEFDERIAGKKTELEALSGQIAAARQEQEQMQAAARDAEGSARGLSRSMEEARAGMSALTQGIADLRVSLSSVEAELRSGEERMAAVESQSAEKQALLSELAAQKKDAQGRLEDCEQIITQNRNMAVGYEKKLEMATARQQSLISQRDKLKLSLSEKNQRRGLLSDMEKQLEGFAYSVKAVMRQSEHGRLRGIHGPVSRLIRVKDEYAAAVETALGGSLQHIVVDKEEDAKAAVSYLKAENAGRATFLPLSSVRGGRLSENGLEASEGFVGIAAELLEYDKAYESVIGSLLGRVAVTEDMDSAVRIARRFGYRFRIVTLDGQVINSGGSITGGSLAKNIGVLSRANEIEKLKAEAEKLSAELTEKEEAIRRAQAENASLEASLGGIRAEQMTAAERKTAAESELLRVNTLLSTTQSQLDSLTAEREKGTEIAKRLTEQAKELSGRLERENAALSEAEAALGELLGNHEQALHRREQLQREADERRYRMDTLLRELESGRALVLELTEQKRFSQQERSQAEQSLLEAEKTIAGLRERLSELSGMDDQSAGQVREKQERIEALGRERDEGEQGMALRRQTVRERTSRKEQLLKELTRLEGRKATALSEYDGYIARLWDEYELTLSAAQELQTPLEDPAGAAKRASDIKNQMKNLGNVNLDAIEEYLQVKERYEFYTVQLADLEKAKTELLSMIGDLTSQMRSIFTEQFALISQRFSEVFRALFGGGRAELRLTDPSDVLTSGIEIHVAPPGKIIKSLASLSGGEQAFVAIALYFAILMVRPSPFCILDEIEAALDDVNVTRFASFLRRFSEKTQFIVITHRRGTMEEADVLYGVTMPERGVSKRRAINVSDVEKKLKIKV